jgi:micrococcal nuclease
VVRIVDGDTIEIMVDGNKDTVRLLLVDTPETKDPNEPIQPFGPEATSFAETVLSDNPLVRIEMDGPERDKYDRLLAYIWVGDKLFNEALIETGLARVAYVYDPPYKHYDKLLAAEKRAKEAGNGIWSIKEYVTSDGFNEEVAVASSSPSVEPSEEPAEDVYYANCAAVRAAGAAPIHEGDPGYSTKLDRDRDGVGCE